MRDREGIIEELCVCVCMHGWIDEWTDVYINTFLSQSSRIAPRISLSRSWPSPLSVCDHSRLPTVEHTAVLLFSLAEGGHKVGGRGSRKVKGAGVEQLRRQQTSGKSSLSGSVLVSRDK